MFSEIGNMQHLLSPEAWLAFGKVVLIDLVLAGDNAIVIGMAAAGLPVAQRGRAILVGIGVATVLRIFFATVAVELLKVVGLALAGGILLLWVCWKMWRELRHDQTLADAEEVISGEDFDHDGRLAGHSKGKTLKQAAMQIVVADISMSLDNVLAVAGAARDHISVLVAGLILSVALMGLAASLIAKLLGRHRWIAYVGLAIILYVALEMIYHGSGEVLPMMKAKLA
jgi:YjbE family integral membrane protein